MAWSQVPRFEALPSEDVCPVLRSIRWEQETRTKPDPSMRVKVIGALAYLSHLGTTVTIEGLPLRRAKDITFAFLLPEAPTEGIVRNCMGRNDLFLTRIPFRPRLQVSLPLAGNFGQHINDNQPSCLP